MTSRALMLLPVVAVLAGCSLPIPMQQPMNVPVFIASYDSKTAFNRLYDVPCSLNMQGNAKKAFASVKTLSGGTDVGGEYPICDIVRTEFESVINRNFMPVTGSLQPKVEMRVHIQRSLLTLDGDRYHYSFAVTVQLLDPRQIEQPYLTKIYSAETGGACVTPFLVPNCVYEAVQLAVAEFVADLESNMTLTNTLDRLTP